MRHLVLRYSYRIVCFDNLGYCSSTNNLKDLDGRENYVFVKGDITKEADVFDAFRKYKIDTVMHLAAQSHVDHSFGNPYKFTFTNVIGTQVMLEAAKKFKVTRFVHMSTDEVYGEVPKTEHDLRETSILAPTNPYAASKAAGDMLISAYRNSYQMPLIVARCNNVFGPFQFPEKLIPKFICLLGRGKVCCLHGDGSNTRRFIFAVDAVSALDTVLHKGQVGSIYNVGTHNEFSNLQVFIKLASQFGLTELEAIEEHVTFTKDRPFNDSRYAIDSRKMEALGWAPRYTFDQGLKYTIEWYKQHGETWWGNIDDILEPFPRSVSNADLPLTV